MKLSYERIYRKTELGVAALKTRAGPLTAQSRTALILINGRESLAALTGKIGTEAGTLVDTLMALGLIEEVADEPAPPRAKPPSASTLDPAAATAPTASPAAPPQDPAAPAALLARLLPLKREAMIRLAPQFGPDVDVICQPMLAATTEQAYREALAAIESKLSIYLGRKAAQRMLDGLLP
jgi:pyruvate/2-oxoglutarate dehydrogenase complex dihydrolipoamide acyltransferase (E2) component